MSKSEKFIMMFSKLDVLDQYIIFGEVARSFKETVMKRQQANDGNILLQNATIYAGNI